MNCIFCKIIDGEIPSYKIYEDENVIAFLDISQLTKGHTLVVPKKHVKNVYEMNEDLASKVFQSVPKIANALKKAFNPIGLNVINNNEKPHQSVDHFHIHLVPRYENDEFKMEFINHQDQYEDDDYEKVLNKIKNNL
ncbi:MAG: HIT family protein [Tenericutes bacterium]|jgi:histidine triad (HIT) family protein|nr:HIT family protein [Mycoplasmatota bacterium]